MPEVGGLSELGDTEVTLRPGSDAETVDELAGAAVGVGDDDVMGSDGGVEAMVMLAVTCVALLNVVETTVMPVPEKLATAPLTKPVPLMLTLALSSPARPCWARPN